MSGIEAAWHISSKSDASGNTCVEAGPLLDGSGRVAVRHSQHRDGAILLYPRAGWNAFLAGAKEGRFARADLR